MKSPRYLWISLCLCLSAMIQNVATSQSFSADDKIKLNVPKSGKNPLEVVFRNNLEVNNSGGHLQGIQQLDHGGDEYFVFSGSSLTYSYYAIAKGGEVNRILSINKILDKPFKHAGGFQIYQDLMAIGVEDNDEKNKSKVFIFHLDNPEKPPEKPLAIIDRMGTFKRATAGCVGIATLHGKVIVVVGDWDTEHLDFYRIDEDKLFEEGATLELEYSLNTKKLDKSSWIDERWLSYQNINFIVDQNNTLFLAGMTSNENEENVLDIFLVETSDLSSFQLKKVDSVIFPSKDSTRFRWGAGIWIEPTQGIHILSCGENIRQESIVHIYK